MFCVRPVVLWPDDHELASEYVVLEVCEHDECEVVERGVVEVAERDFALRFQLVDFIGVFLSQRFWAQQALLYSAAASEAS